MSRLALCKNLFSFRGEPKQTRDLIPKAVTVEFPYTKFESVRNAVSIYADGLSIAKAADYGRVAAVRITCPRFHLDGTPNVVAIGVDWGHLIADKSTFAVSTLVLEPGQSTVIYDPVVTDDLYADASGYGSVAIWVMYAFVGEVDALVDYVIFGDPA